MAKLSLIPRKVELTWVYSSAVNDLMMGRFRDHSCLVKVHRTLRILRAATAT